MYATKYRFDVKTILRTFAFAVVLCAAQGAVAQSTTRGAGAPKGDSVLLSERTEGNYLVRSYLIRDDADADYALRYRISSSELTTDFDGNSGTLDGLNRFLQTVDRDSMMQIRSILITGYASPDGVPQRNQQLAQMRAQSLQNYLDKHFGWSKRYDVRTVGVASDWNAARKAIAQSAIPEKQTVLQIIDQRDAPQAKEERLKALAPAVWSYLAERILPPMRYAEVAIAYSGGRVVETRMWQPQPEPEVVIVEEVEEEVCEPRRRCRRHCGCADLVATGIIVEMPDVPVDF